jgi:DNA end-binding protein Ku
VQDAIRVFSAYAALEGDHAVVVVRGYRGVLLLRRQASARNGEALCGLRPVVLLLLRRGSRRRGGALLGVPGGASQQEVNMPARAIWRGVLKVGRDGIPVRLYSAVEDRTVHFHLLERRTHERVKQHMVNPRNGEEVPTEEIRKGYEVDQDRFVIIAEDELTSLTPEASRDIEVPHFLPEGRIPHPFYERPYYLGPDGDTKSYFALAEALERREREGLARWVMRGRQYLGALCAREGYLLLITLRHSEEVLSARELPAPGGKAPDTREIAMAEQLVATLEGEFRAEDYSDEYRARVLQHIKAKAKGRKPRLAKVPKRRETPTSLVDVLAASLKQPSGRREKRVA